MSEGTRKGLAAIAWPVAAAALAGALAWGSTQAEIRQLDDRSRMNETCIRELTRTLDRLQVDVGWIRQALEGRRRPGEAP